MSNGFTITNAPPPAEPSQLAEITALVAAVGTALSGIMVPIVFLLALLIFRKPVSDVIRNLSSLEGPGGMKVQTHERLRPATEAVEEMTAENIAAAAPPVEEPHLRNPDARADTKSEIDPAHEPVPDDDAGTVETEQTGPSSTRSPKTLELYQRLIEQLKTVDGHTAWYVGASMGTVDNHTFDDLLRTHPASAVLFAWNEVEGKLRALAKSRGVATRLHRAPARLLISELKRADAMPIELAELLREMMEVRADAMHSGGQISEATALDFRRSAEVASREIARQIWRGTQTNQAWLREE